MTTATFDPDAPLPDLHIIRHPREWETGTDDAPTETGTQA